MLLKPGGRRTATVHVTPSFLGGTSEACDNPHIAPGWHAQLAVAAERVEGLVPFKPLDDPSENARVTL
jgi:hypothetical protein